MEELKLRELRASDVFLLVRLINCVGLERIRGLLGSEAMRTALWTAPTMIDDHNNRVPLPREKWTDRQIRDAEKAAAARLEVSMLVTELILSRLPDCQDVLFELLGAGLGIPAEQVAEMEAVAFLDALDRYVSRDGFMDFFGRAWRFVSGRKQRSGSSTGSTADTPTPSGSWTDGSGPDGSAP